MIVEQLFLFLCAIGSNPHISLRVTTLSLYCLNRFFEILFILKSIVSLAQQRPILAG